MKDKNHLEMEEAARQFESHAKTCTVCASDGLDMCDEGMRLMYIFQAALHYSIIGTPYKKGKAN